jgi:hypothetical protein
MNGSNSATSSLNHGLGPEYALAWANDYGISGFGSITTMAQIIYGKYKIINGKLVINQWSRGILPTMLAGPGWQYQWAHVFYKTIPYVDINGHVTWIPNEHLSFGITLHGKSILCIHYYKLVGLDELGREVWLWDEQKSHVVWVLTDMSGVKLLPNFGAHHDTAFNTTDVSTVTPFATSLTPGINRIIPNTVASAHSTCDNGNVHYGRWTYVDSLELLPAKLNADTSDIAMLTRAGLV